MRERQRLKEIEREKEGRYIYRERQTEGIYKERDRQRGYI